MHDLYKADYCSVSVLTRDHATLDSTWSLESGLSRCNSTQLIRSDVIWWQQNMNICKACYWLIPLVNCRTIHYLCSSTIYTRIRTYIIAFLYLHLPALVRIIYIWRVSKLIYWYIDSIVNLVGHAIQIRRQTTRNAAPDVSINRLINRTRSSSRDCKMIKLQLTNS